MTFELTVAWPPAIVAASAAVSAVFILASRPILRRHFVAVPDERSLHSAATPQGAGIAVTAATILVAMTVAWATWQIDRTDVVQLAILCAAAAALCVAGAWDDIKPLPVSLKLFAQIAAVGVVILMMPDQVRALPSLPLWAERAIALVAGVWIVNAVNFMDGLDLMTVAGIVPVAGGFAMLAAIGSAPGMTFPLALALTGALIGFAPFNRPVARLFLGDAGSLPIGLMLFWLCYQLACSGHLLVAILLPLYYLADTTITLIRRTVRGRPITEAHREHFYQRAIARGFGTMDVVGLVFVANVALVALGGFAALSGGFVSRVGALVIGGIIVTGLLAAMGGVRR
jgi:UDP-N-acetylmuramyl pentapeptide phosphotransferase/UDP-N-acetylglucosamine-1-phosphate transferase